MWYGLKLLEKISNYVDEYALVKNNNLEAA